MKRADEEWSQIITFMFAITYFFTSKVMLSVWFLRPGLCPKKVKVTFRGRFDLVYDPKKVKGQGDI